MLGLSKGGFLIGTYGLYDVRVKLRFPVGTEDLVTGEHPAESVTLPLKSYELKAYAAPAGRPAPAAQGTKTPFAAAP